MSALYTVTEQKSKMEATYVSEKKKLKVKYSYRALWNYSIFVFAHYWSLIFFLKFEFDVLISNVLRSSCSCVVKVIHYHLGDSALILTETYVSHWWWQKCSTVAREIRFMVVPKIWDWGIKMTYKLRHIGPIMAHKLTLGKFEFDLLRIKCLFFSNWKKLIFCYGAIMEYHLLLLLYGTKIT